MNKTLEIRGFGGELMIEPTNHCNLKCPLCPSPNNMERDSGYLDFAVYQGIIDEAVGRVQAVDLWNFGEPFLHPRLFEMIAYAEGRRLRTRISTNSTMLDGPRVEGIFSSGLSELIVCLDGATAATHQQYRVGSDFDEVLRGIRRLCGEKRRRGASHPEIRLNFLVMAHNEHEIPAMVTLAGRLGVDNLVLKNVSLGTWMKGHLRQKLVKRFIPRNDVLRKYDIDEEGHAHVREPGAVCPWSEANGVVLWNGDVTMCCYDADGRYSVGNVRTDGGLAAVLDSPRMEARRREIRDRELSICRSCQFSRYPSTSVPYIAGHPAADVDAARALEIPLPRDEAERVDVLLHSDHLIGVGHYVRARALVCVAVAQGLRVAWMLGSDPPDVLPPPPGVEMIYLPPFSEGGQFVAEPEQHRHLEDVRIASILSHLARLQPRLLVTETFPFGRFRLLPELLGLVHAAQRMDPRPLVACTLRDLPAYPTDPAVRRERLLDVRALLAEYYDGLMVHADPSVVDAATATGGIDLPIPHWMTGYVDGDSPPRESRPEPGHSTGLVAFAGGGAVGARLLSTVLEAARAGLLGTRQLTLVTGPRMPTIDRDRLLVESREIPGVQLIWSTAELRALLAGCEVAVCQAGYNSCLDVLVAGVPTVLVPVEDSGDQPARARLWEQSGAAVTLPEGQLTPTALAEAVRRATLEYRPDRSPAIDRRGAEVTVDLWRRWIAGGRIL